MQGWRRNVLGTWINVGTVLLGSGIGLLLGSRISERLRETVMQGIGVVTVLIGLQMALSTQHVLVILGSILTGGVIGTWWRLDERLNQFGNWVERRVMRLTRGQAAEVRGRDAGRFAQAFITTSLLFCIGPMTFLGAIQDGLSGDFELLAVKSVLDGFSAIAFAASLGAGVMMSALTVLVIQGSLTLMSGFFHGWLNDLVIGELTAAGGVMVIMIGLNLLRLCVIRVADFLPALLMTPLLLWAVTFFA
jgi:hypothetical protein